jgi:hypothetical protein
MPTTPASAVTGYFNATVPERVPTISFSSLSVTLGTDDARVATDVFVTDRGSTNDPVAGFNYVVLGYSPVVTYPVLVYRNGIRQTDLLDYVLTTGVNTITFPGKPFSAGEVILVDYLTTEAI